MVTTQEVQPTAQDVAPDASGQLNQNGYGELNQGTGATGTYSDGLSDEAASDEDGTLTEDEIDPEIVQRVLAQREQELRGKIDPELRKFHSSMQRREAQFKREARENQQALITHMTERLEKLGIDPAELQLDVLNAKQITTRDQVRQRFAEGESYWKQTEPDLTAAFSEFEQENGVHPATGQWVVNVNDPELVTLKRQATDLMQMYILSGQDDNQLLQQAQQAADRWRKTVKAKAKAGNGSGTPTSQPRQQQQPSQQQQALAAAAKRGKVIAGRPGGGSAPVTYLDYFAQAQAEMPQANRMDQIQRATELKLIAKESQRK